MRMMRDVINNYNDPWGENRVPSDVPWHMGMDIPEVERYWLTQRGREEDCDNI